ncbi:MAG TPA: ROK family protein [Vicinamibacterales bacterium]|jgi:glucokinase
MTPALGLELRDATATALAVDDAGGVVARVVVPSRGDFAAAALEAVDAVARTAGSGPLGIAADFGEGSSPAAVIALLKQRYAGPFVQFGVTPPGTAAAVAEAWVGAARNARDLVFFAVADHAIAGLIRDGAPVVGVGRRAASVAWLALNPVEREDYRKIGCLEAEVAATGIVRRLIWRIKAGDRSRVADTTGGDLSGITADDVLNAARDGDGVSISVVRDTAKYLGMAAANLVVISDPEKLVLGGIMATAADLLFEPVRTELARRLPRPMMEALAIAPAALGADAAAIGAARLATAALR